MAGDELEFVTEQPDQAYRELAAIIAETGASVRGLQTLDHSLEAVFQHVTEAGARRL